MPLHAHTKQYAILSGELYFEQSIAGVFQGERYLGNSPSAELSIEPQKIDHYDADSNAVSKDFSFATRVDRAMALTLDDMSEENAALFFSAAASSVAQLAVAVVAEAVSAVQRGRYYQLGQTNLNPTGVRNVTAVALKKAAAVMVLNTDYLLDVTRGRIYILPTSATILAGDNLTVDYTPVVNTRRRLASSAGTTVEGRMRFLANNLAGANRDYYFPSVSITPSGSFQLKGGGENPTVGTLGLSVEILKPANAEAIYIDGVAA